MSACNLRSLLVAAIVLSNCITWTASRHHFTHNVHGHRSRHRRQGTGLYLSSSYVVPGGEGEGWGEWGEISPCSRTCGGGVAHQKRICLEFGPDGRPRCRGGDTKYFSCETQDCPSDANDFRAEQCAEFNDKEFRGFKYDWIPYTKSVNPCELNCMPRAERFYYRHKPKVIDGTQCNEDSYDVCVNGVCQPVGCDMMLGSNAREDKCRVCRGNGSNCVTSAGIIDSQDLVKGYNDILLIPAGSTTILIEEIAPSNNYLALRNQNGTYYLNGHYHIDFPKSTLIAGALWNYERSQAAFPSPDKLKCLGPTNEPLYLSILLQDENVGIQYEYSVPKNIAPFTHKRYSWVHEEFSPCNASCGGGIQTRNVTCRSREELDLVDDGLCDAGLKPVTVQACNPEPCPAEWVEGPWSECSKRCGKEGVRKRDVTCEKIIANGYPSIVAEKECFDLHGPKPELYQECNRDAPCPKWFVGKWKPCDKLCDEGKQTRQVVCYQKQSNGRIEIFNNSECEGEMPETEKPCILSLCDGVDWVTSEWLGCDTCLSTVRTRTAVCSTKSSQVYNDSACEYHRKPVTEEPCEKVPPCDYQWYASQWDKCSVECGEGIQSRKVFCGLYDGENVREVKDVECADQPKYNDTKPCKVPDEKCPSQWFASPWTECSAECGGGIQDRHVMCMKGSQHAADCLAVHSPDSTRPCNSHKCNEDDLIPVDHLSGPILDDDCEEEEVYDEEGLDALTPYDTTLKDGSSAYADTESGFETTDTSESSEFSTNPTIDYDYLGEDNHTSSTDYTDSTDTSLFSDTEATGSTESTVESSSDSTESKDTDDTDITTVSSKTSNTAETKSSEDEETGSTATLTTEATLSTDNEPTGSDETTGSSITSSDSTSPGSSTSGSESTSPGSVSSASDSTSPESSTSGSKSTSPESSSSGSESTSPKSSSSGSESTSPESSTLGSESTSPESSTSGSESTSPDSSSSVSGSTSSDSSSSVTESTSPESSTLGSESTSPESSTSGSESTSSESSSSASESTSAESSTSESESTSPEYSTSESESTSPETSTSESETTSPETSTSESESTSPESSSSVSESTSPESSTSGSESTSPESSTLRSESTSPESSSSVSESTSPKSSSSVSESTTTESSTLGSESTSPESSTSGSESTSPESSSSGSESTTPESSSSGSESTSPETSTVGSESTSPETSTLGSESTSPESSTSASESTSPESSTSASESTSPETSTLGSESTSPESSTSGSVSTSPESSTLGSESTSPESSTSGSESTSPESSTSGSESTSPESSTLGSESTTPESSTSGSESTSPESTSPESSTSESGTESTEVGSTTETGGTSESSTEAVSTSESTSTESSDSTTDTSESSTDLSTDAVSTTPWSFTTVTKAGRPKVCRPRKKVKCNDSKFGCCPDKKTAATGPFDEGCPKPRTCKESKFGCCPDGVSPAAGADEEGCPYTPCEETLFGCCLNDNRTAALGNDQEGCLPPCAYTEFGCCADEETEAGKDGEGCPENETTTTEEVTETESSTSSETSSDITSESTTSSEGISSSESTVSSEGSTPSEATASSEVDSSTTTESTLPEGCDEQGCPCNTTEFGCCPDGVSPAQGKDNEGCQGVCKNSPHGCCEDNETPAHGPDYEGCCLLTAFGCCPDNRKAAEGPHLEGCGCQLTQHGCCPDNVTAAQGPKNEGCGCQYTEFGCCPDRHTQSPGPNFEGCSCQTYQFGCCPDGVTIATSPDQQSCRCQYSTHGCCGDEQTAATGPNGAGCDCASSKYGCCPDGQTEATGPKFVGCTDVPENKQAVCSLSTDAGPCTNFTAMWFYDLNFGGCSRFWYGGCEGNGNRFGSKEECEDICVQPGPKEACKLPDVRGPCESDHVRWYFNSTREQCLPFRYGGCLGNANNFDTRELCQTQCEPDRTTDTCNLPIEQGPCAGNFKRWGYNSESQNCEQFTWGGCEGNHNRFTSEYACKTRCSSHSIVCAEQQEAGNCTEKEALWSFSQTENRCVPFYYTGCGGNRNRFDSKEICEQICPSVYVPDKCTLPAATGDCSEYREKWFYDTRIQRCRQFYYGGCGGNQNNFDSEIECSNVCSEPITTTTTVKPTQPTQPTHQTAPPVPPPEPDRESFCFLEIDSGSTCTLASVETRYAYDSRLGKCITFTHNGCGGNQNNFPNEEFCTYYCHPVQDVCQLPMISGPCDESLMRWFYDPVSDSCSQFTYGGCQGNDNRFESREACESRCRTGPTPQPITQRPTEPVTASTVGIEHRFGEQIPKECIISPVLEECKSVGEVWYFNPRHHECMSHVNQERGRKCRHTATFDSQEACERGCGAFRGVDVCRQRLDPGPCQEFVTKVYFDSDANTCKQFEYSGCLGGANRFSSIEECTEVCRPEAVTPDVCSLPPEQGDCNSYVEKWYYDYNHGVCSEFVYTGCGGNDNRYDTRQECEARCRNAITTTTTTAASIVQEQEECKTPRSLAPCGYNLTVFYYDSNTAKCLPSEFGNCRHPNAYRSEEECERQCGAFRGRDICRERLDPGPCRNPIMKYYFDSTTGSCQPFTYGGCDGGPNRFSTAEECEELCADRGPGNNEVDCESYERQCASLTCDNIVRSSAPGGCESCACADTTPLCQQFRDECDRLRCPYGVYKVQDRDCERCICHDDPCRSSNCTENERCVSVAVSDPVTGEPRYTYRCEGAPSAPVAIPPTEPEKPVEASEGGQVTLRCLFHSNPPPKITWRKGEITIDGNVGRYRLTSDGALQIVSLYRNDTGVYICVADNEYGTATQQIHLVVKEPTSPPEPIPPREPEKPIEAKEGAGVELRCLFHSNPPPKISWRRGEIAIDGNVGRYRLTSEGVLQIVSLHRNDTGVYICVADNGIGTATQQIQLVVNGGVDEVPPDCSAYQAECARINCEYDTQYTRTPDGCERCQCVTPQIDCEPLREECSRLRCNFGMERTVGPDGCERCRCKVEVNPCATANCLPNERCVMVPYRDPLTQEPRYDAECRTVLKPGLCPVDDFFSNDVICDDDCLDDADCRGIGKCCMRGCKRMCVEPAASTIPPTTITTTHTPDLPGPPVALPQPKPDLSWSEGGKATLRCVFHSNPPPRITWRRGELTINGNVGRYRLTSEGALEIVSLYRNDTGVYICVADNGLGTATQQINLVVTDPEGTPVGIAGDENAVITGELDRPLVLRCLAYGYPTPSVFWTRYNSMVPFNDGVYEIRGNTLLIRNLAIETLGQYTCQAYNGVGKAASWVVLVRAYRPDGFFLEHENLVPRQNIYTTRRTLPTTPETTTTTSTTTERPVFFTVPVAVHVSATYSTLNIGTALKLACEVDGYPEPNVYWTKDGQTIVPDDRVLISGTTTSRLLISRATVTDSGLYGCHADNGYSSQSDTAQINVQQLTVPAKCTDNPFFAKCDLIVRNNFCNHKYYSKFCCKSCVEAGQLDPQVAEAQADQPFRKK